MGFIIIVSLPFGFHFYYIGREHVSSRYTRFIVALSLCALAIAGCRPSQQSRRNDTKTSQQKNAASAQMYDSLLILQDKLITVIDTMTNVLGDHRKRIRDLEAEVNRLRALLEHSSASQTPMSGGYVTAPPVTPPPVPEAYTQPTTTAPPDEKYSNALMLFNASRYSEALAAFDELAHAQPNSPYMPNYLYWRGELMYALGDYDNAIRSFHDVLEKYPNSGKSDDAEYKIAASYEKLGENEIAKSAYQRLILSYPESEYVARAKARLKKLN